MKIADILSLGRTCYKADVTSKKKALELIANLIEKDCPHLRASDIFDALIEREKLGSTGLSHGIAIPHARSQSTDKVISAVVLLKKPIEFDSLDNKETDILFCLIVPEEADETQLEVLSCLAEKLENAAYREHLHHSASQEELYARAIE